MTPKKTILITGAVGGIARLMVENLRTHYNLVGVDPRPLPEDREFPGEFFQVDYRSRKMAEVFRSHEFSTLLHLGRVALGSNAIKSVRYNMNVLGTRNLLELSVKYAVKRVVVCSTYHVYGAHPHNHLGLTEDDPLRASHVFPELIDAVDMDNVCTAFLMKYPKIRTLVLRPVNVVGPNVRNRISQFLRSGACPYVLGFDPPMQFMHENDLVRALMLAVESKRRGVYNVAGEGVVPFTHAIRLAGSTPVPIPQFLTTPAVSALTWFGMNFPKHLVDYFRFPVIVSDAAFRTTFDYAPSIDTVGTLSGLRHEFKDPNPA